MVKPQPSDRQQTTHPGAVLLLSVVLPDVDCSVQTESNRHICSQSSAGENIPKLVVHVRRIHDVYETTGHLRHKSEVNEPAVRALEADH